MKTQVTVKRAKAAQRVRTSGKKQKMMNSVEPKLHPPMEVVAKKKRQQRVDVDSSDWETEREGSSIDSA